MAKILGLERVLCRLKDGTLGLFDPLGSPDPDLFDHGKELKSKDFEFSR